MNIFVPMRGSDREVKFELQNGYGIVAEVMSLSAGHISERAVGLCRAQFMQPQDGRIIVHIK